MKSLWLLVTNMGYRRSDKLSVHRLLGEALPTHLGAWLPLRRAGRRALRRVQHLHGGQAPLLEALQRVRVAPRHTQEGIPRIQLSTATGKMAVRVSYDFFPEKSIDSWWNLFPIINLCLIFYSFHPSLRHQSFIHQFIILLQIERTTARHPAPRPRTVHGARVRHPRDRGVGADARVPDRVRGRYRQQSSRRPQSESVCKEPKRRCMRKYSFPSDDWYIDIPDIFHGRIRRWVHIFTRNVPDLSDFF